MPTEKLTLHGLKLGSCTAQMSSEAAQEHVVDEWHYMKNNDKNAFVRVKDLNVYTACVRSALDGQRKWNAQVSILRKGTSWVRDAWLANSMWSNRDLLLHGWKLRSHAFLMGLDIFPE
uniref:Uncharacterized protein n=1 Tax=Parascaris univalens TaxID=6257 RepID=A0A915CGH5_PARUN